MSTSYSIFIKTEKTVSEVKSCLEKILNCSLEKDDDSEIYTATLLGVTLDLFGSVRYENDGLIEFSRYDYFIKINYTGAFEKQYSDDFCLMTLIVIANMLSRQLNCECIVVEDVQKVIEKFTPNQ